MVDGKSERMDLETLVARFDAVFGRKPTKLYRAPGRVNLIGEHTDYNDGFVMPAAIGFSTYVAIAPREDQKLSVRSHEMGGDFVFDLDRLPHKRVGGWCDYVVGVASILQSHGHKLSGADLLVHGEVPIGAGLSSSAAIEVASALALMDISKIAVPLPEVARLCREAENNFVGARVGIMDQFVSCLGKAGQALLLDCRSLDFKYVSIPSDMQIVVCNTMVKHDVAAGEYNTRREECESAVRYFAQINPAIKALRDVSIDLLEQKGKALPATIFKRCSHVIHENERTLKAADALIQGEIGMIGRLMRDSHNSLRDLYEVSCKELDIMVDAAQDLPGFCGGRMTGGGFGGCTVNLVREESASEFADQIAERYHRATEITPQVYLCPVAEGAQEIPYLP